MAKQKLSALAAPFQGKWRIAEMDVWDNEAIDLLGRAFIAFKGQEGEMRFIALTAWLDVRYDARNGGPLAQFSWEGDDEDDQSSGRGWVALGTAGRLVGHVYIHRGDDSGFVCEPGEFFNGLLADIDVDSTAIDDRAARTAVSLRLDDRSAVGFETARQSDCLESLLVGNPRVDLHRLQARIDDAMTAHMRSRIACYAEEDGHEQGPFTGVDPTSTG